MSRRIGDEGEKQAKDYLLGQGLEWLESNYSCPFGEIDLIMLEKDTLVFIEVRARLSAKYGGAIASVNRTKQGKLIKTALHYIKGKRRYQDFPARFDVVCIEGSLPGYNWVKNAFEVNC